MVNELFWKVQDGLLSMPADDAYLFIAQDIMELCDAETPGL